MRAEATSVVNFGLSLILLIMVSIFTTSFLMALYIDNAAKYFLSSRKPLSSSIGTANKKFFILLRTYLLMAVILIAVFGIPLLATIESRFAPGGMALGIASLLMGAFFVFLSPYIAVLDRYGAVDSIRISVRLVNRNKVRMFLFFVLYLVIWVAISLASPPIIAALVALLIPVNPVFLLLQLLVSTYTTLFAYSAFTNLYLSIRRRK
jgi:hypothetical protein